VNGISDDDVLDAPKFAEIAKAVSDMLSDAVIVCHNASFDLGFVSSEMRRAGYAFKPGTVVDTLAIARNCFRFSSNSLSNIARALAISTPNAHRAMGDVLTTRGVLRRFVDELAGRGVQSLDDLLAAQGGVQFAPIMRAADDVPLPPEIGEALSSGKRLFLKYLDASGKKSERWVTPQQVTGLGNILYLVAFCHLRQEKRNFRLDRIVEMRLE
jgi:DNA polymerase III epsilon subunit-like protein